MGQAGEHHIATTGQNMVILILLLILTGLTVWAPNWGLGHWGPVVAFAIASTKAYLVLAYFMHLKYDKRENTAIIASTLFFLILLVAFCVIDIVTRITEVSPL